MKWKYELSSNSIWTSFDFGEVEADTYEEAKAKALKQLKYDLEKANHVLQSSDITSDFTIGMDFDNLIIEELVFK